jgi:hypothetical protein
MLVSPAPPVRIAPQHHRFPVHRSTPMPISAHHKDPVLETLARGVYALFPRCIRCGWLIETFEEADVQILAHRVVHRDRCPAEHRPTPVSTAAISEHRI